MALSSCLLQNIFLPMNKRRGKRHMGTGCKNVKLGLLKLALAKVLPSGRNVDMGKKRGYVFT